MFIKLSSEVVEFQLMWEAGRVPIQDNVVHI